MRDFLNFDMTRAKDIFMQDQLAWGLIEAPRSSGAVLIVQKSALDNVGDEFLSQLDGASGGDAGSAKGDSSKALASQIRQARGANHLENVIWETASQSRPQTAPKRVPFSARSVQS